jgi:hypothetical protein
MHMASSIDCSALSLTSSLLLLPFSYAAPFSFALAAEIRRQAFFRRPQLLLL